VLFCAARCPTAFLWAQYSRDTASLSLCCAVRRTKYKKHHGVLPEKPEAAIKATAEKRQNARANAKKKGAQSPRPRGSSSIQL